MLNNSILDGWADWTLAKESGKDINLPGRTSEDQGGGRSHNEVEEWHIQAEGSSQVLLRLGYITTGRKRGRLGSHRQRRHSNAAKLKNTVHKVR